MAEVPAGIEKGGGTWMSGSRGQGMTMSKGRSNKKLTANNWIIWILA
jgi:hypothetical protein